MNDIKYVKRSPEVGDVVQSILSHRLYLVEEVLRDYRNHIEYVGVRSIEDGLVNAFRPREVKVLTKASAKAVLYGLQQ